MKIIKTFCAAALLSCCVPVVHAADAEGQFWMGGGVGGVKCPQFVASMEKARSLGTGSVAYTNETRGFSMYVLGFQTGYNVSTKDTCNIFPGEGQEYSLLSWVENYCRANSTARFSDAVVALGRDRHPKRLKVCAK